MIYLWLAALVIFIIFEVATINLVSIWFAIGSFAALIATLFGAPLWLQIVLFFVVSGIILAFLRPAAKKYFAPRDQHINADRVIDLKCNVTEDISNLDGTGAVFVDGKTWTARSKDGSVIPAGTLVRVVAIDGVKLIVEAVEETSTVNN